MKKRAGFTLIELMIVVAIIGILASIAIPNYLKFEMKARQSEAKMNLGAIFICQKSYYGEFSTYAGGSLAFDRIGWSPMTGQVIHYAYLMDGALVMPQAKFLHGSVSFPGFPPVDERSFSASAATNLDKDAFVDVWSINDHADLRNRVIDTSGAWGADGNDVSN
jgi:type IV pilus assembly protein PilA